MEPHGHFSCHVESGATLQPSLCLSAKHHKPSQINMGVVDSSSSTSFEDMVTDKLAILLYAKFVISTVYRVSNYATNDLPEFMES